MPERGLTTETLSRTEDLRGAHVDWIALCAHPEAHPLFIEAACTADATVIRPHVVQVRREGIMVGLAVARLERAPLPIGFGPVSLATPRVATVKLSYNGIIGAENADVWSQLWVALSEPLRNGEAHAIYFDHIAVGSPLQPFVSRPPSGFIRDLMPVKLSTHWIVNTTTNYESYVLERSKNMRHNIKRTAKRVEDLANRTEVRRYASLDDLPTIMADTEAIASQTFHRKIGVGFDTCARHRAMTRAGLEIGAFRADILYLDGKPVAYWHFLQWRATRYTTHTGYSQTFAKMNFGSYLLQQLIADAFADPATDRIDFGFGDAPYKVETGTSHWQECSRLIYARRPKAAGLNLLRGGVGNVASHADRTLAALGAREKVKTFWRKRVLPQKNSDTR